MSSYSTTQFLGTLQERQLEILYPFSAPPSLPPSFSKAVGIHTVDVHTPLPTSASALVAYSVSFPSRGVGGATQAGRPCFTAPPSCPLSFLRGAAACVHHTIGLPRPPIFHYPLLSFLRPSRLVSLPSTRPPSVGLPRSGGLGAASQWIGWLVVPPGPTAPTGSRLSTI